MAVGTTTLRFVRLCIFLTLGLTLAFRTQAVQGAEPEAVLELVQTVPVETELGLPGLRSTDEVWLAMLDRARERIDVEHFYVANEPGSRLEPVVAALEAAARRGVRVRVLADARFAETYPETLARLDDREGIEVRRLDLGPRTDGVLHAKVLLVDGREGFVGSPNLDWRALEHVAELGVRFEGERLVAPFADVFELDWRLAADPTAPVVPREAGPLPVSAADGTRVTPVFSPRELLPDPTLWDLPRLVDAIDGARERVRLQGLTYRATDAEGYWDGIEAPLRRAAARGVDVQLLVSHWSLRSGVVEGLQSLQCLPNVEVRVLTVPEWSGGFLDYARVAHAKLLVADGERGWLGTSNVSRDYFHASRNAGLLVEGPLAGALDRYFAMGWTSEHAETLEPGRTYDEPVVAR